jgi:CcmD family protein
MNPILSDIYSTVIPSAPFVIGAYAFVWLALLVYVVMVVRGLKKTESQMAALEEALASKESHARLDT